jgi:hypothetical protein
MNKSIFLLLATLIIYGQSYSQAVTYEHARKKAQNHFDAGNNLLSAIMYRLIRF